MFFFNCIPARAFPPVRLAVLAALVTGTGCGGDDATDVSVEYSVRFGAAVGAQSARCGQQYTGLGTEGATVELLDLRFYVSNLRLVEADGREQPLELAQDRSWQTGNVALLDFEDGSGACELGNPAMSDRVVGSAPPGDYQGIAFDLAVPFQDNHGDQAGAPAPLNIPAMFWNWAGGRKFVRIDLGVGTGRWNFHLGSTRCESAGAEAPPGAECGRPNRPQIRLDDFNPEADTIVLDLEALFADSNLADNTPETPLGCQSFPAEAEDCETLFTNLGLSFESGLCERDCTQQSLFSIVEM